MKIRVLVADDHALVREGIRHVLDSETDIEVVGEASNGTDAVNLALEQAPDVVVLDITMPGETGLKAAARLLELLPSTRVLLLSMHDNVEYVREGIRIGTHGYILKDSAGEELCAAIRAVFVGGTFFSPSVVRRLSQHDTTAEAALPGSIDSLTPREKDVLIGIAGGHTNKSIAAELGISPRTVEAHRESLMKKLQIHTVAGLTRLALESGIVREN